MLWQVLSYGFGLEQIDLPKQSYIHWGCVSESDFGFCFAHTMRLISQPLFHLIMFLDCGQLFQTHSIVPIKPCLATLILRSSILAIYALTLNLMD